MSWLILILSGALEAVWAAALHRTFQASGRRRVAPALLFLAAVLASMAGLAIAMQAIPTGTAYAVWVGIGAALTVGWAMATGVEPFSVLKVLFIAGIVGCAAGLKSLPAAKSARVRKDQPV